MSNLLETLKQFTGSETYYRNPLYRKFIYTNGVKYLVEQAQAYWLIDYIFSNQYDPKIRLHPFQTWTIKIKDDNTATIRVEDGNKNLIKNFKLTFTDFPLSEFTLWFTDHTLLLPSEY